MIIGVAIWVVDFLCLLGQTATPGRDLTAALCPARLHAATVLTLYPFRFRDPVSGKWVKARYKAERQELAAAKIDRCVRWSRAQLVQRFILLPRYPIPVLFLEVELTAGRGSRIDWPAGTN